MPTQDEKLELAWLITKTEGLLTRTYLKHTYAEPGAERLITLTPQQCHMVMVLYDGGSMTLRQLTQALHVGPSAASIMVERLVELGVLTREENPKDCREVLVEVASSHRGAVEGLKRQYVRTVLDVFDKIGMDTARAWGAVCRRIQEAFAAERKL